MADNFEVSLPEWVIRCSDLVVVSMLDGRIITATNIRKIIVDTETGVNYLMLSSNMTSGCGVAVLVDKDGKPIVTAVNSES